jgi:hypothetical protein
MLHVWDVLTVVIGTRGPDPSMENEQLTRSMRRTYVSIANCSNPSLGRHLLRPTTGWVSCRRFDLASSRV